MNTELFELMAADKEKGTQALQEMETERLFAELDDTIQFDIIGVSNEKWATEYHAKKKVYNAIVKELKERLK